ncbi:MAG: hypothetical protein V4496_07750 [Pseudomonadota bacterium]
MYAPHNSPLLDPIIMPGDHIEEEGEQHNQPHNNDRCAYFLGSLLFCGLPGILFLSFGASDLEQSTKTHDDDYAEERHHQLKKHGIDFLITGSAFIFFVIATYCYCFGAQQLQQYLDHPASPAIATARGDSNAANASIYTEESSQQFFKTSEKTVIAHAVALTNP